ncbi:MAG: fatty acid desaturase [Deltaproteobacteria bacterium]|nr:fatty acid desaturase [Deltaproteobacteria bacterium]
MSPAEEKALLEETRRFTAEDRGRSLRETAVTFLALGAATALAAFGPRWPLRALGTLLEALLIVRAFVLYHDVLHGALHRGQRVLRALYHAYGVWVLNPPSVWRQTHNYHHTHTAKIVGSHVGSFPMLTPALYQRLTPAQRWLYGAARHPLNVLFGYVTIFLLGMCASSFLRAPRKNWDSGVALVAHFAGVGLTAWLFGWGVALSAYVVPLALACAVGGYLFYAQHNVPGVYVAPREAWSYAGAALRSSSYLRSGPVFRWFSGNIGYHHVHHLNPGIPFYRLPEVMDALPALQDPPVTSLSPRDVIACFRLKLWDPDAGRMVGFPSTQS